jgi:hypothetical protein
LVLGLTSPPPDATKAGEAALGELAGSTGLRMPYKFLSGATDTTLPPLASLLTLPMLVLLVLLV